MLRGRAEIIEASRPTLARKTARAIRAVHLAWIGPYLMKSRSGITSLASRLPRWARTAR